MYLLAVRATGSRLLPALFAAGSMVLSATVVSQSSQGSDAQTGNAAAQTSPGTSTTGASPAGTSTTGTSTTGTSTTGTSTNSRAVDTAPSPRQAATVNNANNTATAPARNTPSAAQQQSVGAPGITAPDLTTPNTQAHYFSDVDYSNDYRLTWEEIVTVYESEVREGGWTRIEFIEEFDTDGDEFLDEDEYSEFLAEVGLDEPENTSSFIDID